MSSLEQYGAMQFSKRTMAMIAIAQEIMEAYEAAGYTLTLRQLYYQFVAKGYLENTEANYNALGKAVSKGRRAGYLKWEGIEDRTRNLIERPHWTEPGEILRDAAGAFHVDLWEGQPYRVELWVEKDALAGVFEPVCHAYDVPLFACRGYASDSEMWRAGQRIFKHTSRTAPDGNPVNVVILHFGDHDPSGIDMSRDIEDRLAMFSECEPDEEFEIRRLALNYDQVKAYNPPPNPAKTTDTHGSPITSGGSASIRGSSTLSTRRSSRSSRRMRSKASSIPARSKLASAKPPKPGRFSRASRTIGSARLRSSAPGRRRSRRPARLELGGFASERT